MLIMGVQANQTYLCKNLGAPSLLTEDYSSEINTIKSINFSPSPATIVGQLETWDKL